MSSIQWFPGHMHLTRKAIAARMRETDVVIELLDARLPGSSANPLIAELTAGKPALKVLNKQDIADPDRTVRWLAHYNAQAATAAIGLDAGEPAPARRLIDACRTLAPGRRGMARPMRVLVCGVPNVGKSTLINTLVGVKKAKTGDEAGITRAEQRIVLADDFYLWDTPGMLWPRIGMPRAGFHLAAAGSIGRNAYDEQEVAVELLHSLKGPYEDLLRARYRFPAELADEALAQVEDEVLLDAIGKSRGAVQSRGRIDTQKAAEIVLNDFRSAVLGRITLETPEEFAAWEAEAAVAEEERRIKKLSRTAKGRAELADGSASGVASGQAGEQGAHDAS